MDALIGKLTNLGYEFFGILLPGALAVLMWSLLWIAAADVVPWTTWGAVPELTLSEAMDSIGQAIEWSAFMSVLLMIALAYFVGHLLTWMARRGKRLKQVGFWDHLVGTLCFRPPKQEPSYDLRLKPAWKWAGKRLLGKKLDLSWSLFYPAAKTYLLQKRIPSLVTTYQNKYNAASFPGGCCRLDVLGGTRCRNSRPSGKGHRRTGRWASLVRYGCNCGRVVFCSSAFLVKLPLQLDAVGELPHHGDLRFVARGRST